MVYVLNIEGKPLMPTERHSFVRRILRTGRAIVVRCIPFTIQLTYETENKIQDISLGVDSGTAHIGVSACTEKKELFAAEVKLRTDVVGNISTRRELRRTRRNRLRYRKPRFNNRAKSKKKGWLAPSVRHKIDCHKEIIKKVCSILPVSEIHLEIGNFDTQKIKNPDIQGIEYQQGEQLGFWNVREYVLCRDNHTCQHCGSKGKNKSGDKVLEIHHLESRKTGGDSPSNLITLCRTCHKKYHEGKIKLKQKRDDMHLRDAGVMSSMKNALYNELCELYPNVKKTYGYITKYHRIKHNVEKTHIGDARMILKKFVAVPLDYFYEFTKIRRHNRQLYRMNQIKKGKWVRVQSPYKTFGFRTHDVILYKNVVCYITGRRSNGQFSINGANGEIFYNKNGNIANNKINYKYFKFLYLNGGYRKITKRCFKSSII